MTFAIIINIKMMIIIINIIVTIIIIHRCCHVMLYNSPWTIGAGEMTSCVWMCVCELCIYCFVLFMLFNEDPLENEIFLKGLSLIKNL